MSSAEAAAIASAPELLDFEALIAPIPGENPAGENMQYAGLYDEIRQARRADENLAQGVWQYELKVADWGQVIALATGALTTRTKDLLICAWLSEALVKVHGFAGLRDGLRAVREIMQNFWENLYPESDEGDLEARANALYWMDAQLSLIVKEIPLTSSGSVFEYSYLQWSNADKGDKAAAPDAEGEASEGPKVTLEEWDKAKGATRRVFYENTFAVLTECWAEFTSMEQVADEKFGRQAPSIRTLKKSIDDVRTLAERLVKEKRILEPDPARAAEGSPEAEGQDGAAEEGPGLSLGSGPIRTRQEALRRLAQVAEYFRRTEPHNPVSYLVTRAIKWGEMPLETWLQEVIKDDVVLGSLRETLGIKSETDGGY
ncbi:MAG TPA: type VI secretion system protein TssA [Blastocatellia bacterium]|jgi:type VI secretion system protein ImpA|nr:type VI secretion system protein TssA [Blastocatellia bacterium]